MYCNNCGNKINDNSKFCGLCGAKVNTIEQTQQTNTQVPSKINKSTKKLYAVITVLLLVASLLTIFFVLYEKESPVEDFEYEMENGKIIITEYIGNDRKIVIPKKINGRPVTSIGEKAFEKYDMTHVTIPDTVTTVEANAFSYCECLISIKFSDSLKSIEHKAFRNCSSLTEISLPKSLEKIGSRAFLYCSSLKTVKFPKGLKRIEECAFSGCGVTNVTLPENLQFIGQNAFEECKNLKELQLPDNAEIEIYYEENEGWYNTSEHEYFASPVGSSTKYFYDEDFETLSTVLVVKKDSYAYKQVKPYCEGYGLTVKIN